MNSTYRDRRYEDGPRTQRAILTQGASDAHSDGDGPEHERTLQHEVPVYLRHGRQPGLTFHTPYTILYRNGWYEAVIQSNPP